MQREPGGSAGPSGLSCELVASFALIKTGGACNSACRFCHAGGPGGTRLETREVCRRILGALRAGHDGVLLSGGEPTARPDILFLARFARRAGAAFGLVTNGIALSDPTLRASLVEAGLAAVYVSLHGHDPATHDGLTGVASFEPACEAIEAIGRVRDLRLVVTTVVCGPNLEALPATVGLVGRLLPSAAEGAFPRHRLALVEPKGLAARSVDLVPDPAEASEAVEAAMARASGLRVTQDGLPPCLAPEGGGAEDDLRAHGILAMQEAHEDRLYPTDPGARRHAEGCSVCAARPWCSGIYVGYLERGWGRRLVPWDR